jgi:hypothetical protein
LTYRTGLTDADTACLSGEKLGDAEYREGAAEAVYVLLALMP